MVRGVSGAGCRRSISAGSRPARWPSLVRHGPIAACATQEPPPRGGAALGGDALAWSVPPGWQRGRDHPQAGAVLAGIRRPGGDDDGAERSAAGCRQSIGGVAAEAHDTRTLNRRRRPDAVLLPPELEAKRGGWPAIRLIRLPSGRRTGPPAVSPPGPRRSHRRCRSPLDGRHRPAIRARERTAPLRALWAAAGMP